MNNQIAFIRARLQTGEWTFGPEAGKSLTTIMRFAPDGRIKGYEHPNETGWRVDHSGLVIYNSNAAPMWRQVRTVDDGTIVLLSLIHI